MLFSPFSVPFFVWKHSTCALLPTLRSRCYCRLKKKKKTFRDSKPNVSSMVVPEPHFYQEFTEEAALNQLKKTPPVTYCM